MPPVYNLASMSETELDMFGNEVEMWRNEEFMVPIDSNEAKGTVSMMAVDQLHQPSTPARPVLDYRWINSLIKSYPNESLDSPIAAPKFHTEVASIAQEKNVHSGHKEGVFANFRE